ncbi:hypothetical protein ACKKBG_A23535 [Auxenochlorella protothecoides x Auxenochlorella symbiontica]
MIKTRTSQASGHAGTLPCMGGPSTSSLFKSAARTHLRRGRRLSSVRAGPSAKAEGNKILGFSLPGFKGKEPEAQAEESVRSTTKKVAQESQQIGLSLLKNFGRRDTNTVFVAGATGRLGARIVRELLNAGKKVRAGARNIEEAEKYADLAAAYGLLAPDAVRRLQIVPFDLRDDVDALQRAIGNANTVVSAARSTGNDARSIDGEGTVRLVQAAAEAGVGKFTLVSSAGVGSGGFLAGILNLATGNALTFKKLAEDALQRSGLDYTIIRPGNLEDAGDDYKLENNLRISDSRSALGKKVSRLQVAEVVAASIDISASSNKVLEVDAARDAPKEDIRSLLAALDEGRPSAVSRAPPRERVERKSEPASRAREPVTAEKAAPRPTPTKSVAAKAAPAERKAASPPSKPERPAGEAQGRSRSWLDQILSPPQATPDQAAEKEAAASKAAELAERQKESAAAALADARKKAEQEAAEERERERARAAQAEADAKEERKAEAAAAAQQKEREAKTAEASRATSTNGAAAAAKEPARQKTSESGAASTQGGGSKEEIKKVQDMIKKWKQRAGRA